MKKSEKFLQALFPSNEIDFRILMNNSSLLVGSSLAVLSILHELMPDKKQIILELCTTSLVTYVTLIVINFWRFTEDN